MKLLTVLIHLNSRLRLILYLALRPRLKDPTRLPVYGRADTPEDRQYKAEVYMLCCMFYYVLNKKKIKKIKKHFQVRLLRFEAILWGPSILSL